MSQVLPAREKPWWSTPHLLRLNLLLMIVAVSSAAAGYDGALMNGLQSLTQWQEFMDFPTGPWLGFMNALGPIASMAGFPVASYLANRFGRKLPLYIGLIFLIVGGAMGAASPTANTFVGHR
jgi:MFS family permease